MLPIPGTGDVTHLDENVRAASLPLDLDTVEELDTAA
jgi:aryl-alcohol dehydrogenase-like predicted oxidoreductase